MPPRLQAPFPWFGGKRRAADIVWRAFGDVQNYVEPFAGSLAVLLGRPTPARIETVNDLDSYLANFWRAVAADPELVARYADWPVNEADLHARHSWLVDQAEFRERMKTDPEYFDAKISGWWVWGICAWIGSGWCSQPGWTGKAPNGGSPKGIHSQALPWQARPALSGSQGLLQIEKKRPYMGHNGPGVGVHRKRPAMDAKGLSRQLPDLSGDGGAAGRGIHASAKRNNAILSWILALSERIRRVRVCCGDWTRVLGPAVTTCIGTTGVFLDPPYSKKSGRATRLYANDDMDLAHAVRDWALVNGHDRKLRIALCGYEGEHEMPNTWRKIAWKAQGGFAGQGDGSNKNFARERIWFSPACLDPRGALTLFDDLAPAPDRALP